jgi:hypothetical protein
MATTTEKEMKKKQDYIRHTKQSRHTTLELVVCKHSLIWLIFHSEHNKKMSL